MLLSYFSATYVNHLLFLKNPFYAVLLPVDTKKGKEKKTQRKKPLTANKALVSVSYQKKIVPSFKIISIAMTFLQTFAWATPQNFVLNIVPPFLTWKL